MTNGINWRTAIIIVIIISLFIALISGTFLIKDSNIRKTCEYKNGYNDYPNSTTYDKIINTYPTDYPYCIEMPDNMRYYLYGWNDAKREHENKKRENVTEEINKEIKR